MYEETLIDEELSDVCIDDLLSSSLIVYNDDVNSFEWVEECFIKYLSHTAEQAHQCALIIHSKGKCSVKNGSREELLPYRTALVDAGLSAEIK